MQGWRELSFLNMFPKNQYNIKHTLKGVFEKHLNMNYMLFLRTIVWKRNYTLSITLCQCLLKLFFRDG